jgi:hypothetical protein
MGIGIERIQPGHPQQNGRHQRIHLTLKKKPPNLRPVIFCSSNRDVFNNQRRHEALNMKCSAEVWQPSARSYTGLPDIDYPLQGKTIVVTRCGRICLGKKNLISARSLPDKPSASKKSTALWIMIWVFRSVSHVSGPDPAKLGIPRSTLDSKTKQLKIKKQKFTSE